MTDVVLLPFKMIRSSLLYGGESRRPRTTTTTTANSNNSSASLCPRQPRPRLWLQRPYQRWNWMKIMNRWILPVVAFFWIVWRLGQWSTFGYHDDEMVMMMFSSSDSQEQVYRRMNPLMTQHSFNTDSPMKLQPQTQPLQPSPISEEAWQQFLQTFRTSMKVPFQLWLPIVVQLHHVHAMDGGGGGSHAQYYTSGRLLARKEHVYQFASCIRMNSFVQMMWYAMQQLHDTEPMLQLEPQKQQQQQESATKTMIVNIPLLLGIGDHHECGGLFPRFTWCTVLDDDPFHCQNIAIPSFNLFLAAPETSTITRKTTTTTRHRRRVDDDQRTHPYPWSKKKRLAVWRGSPTGRVPSSPDNNNNNDWRALPRVQLVHFSKAIIPHLLDAAFVSIKQFERIYPDHVVSQLRQQSRFAQRMNLPDFQQYRAIVDMDGNSWSSRFGELLCMNSVILKVCRCIRTCLLCLATIGLRLTYDFVPYCFRRYSLAIRITFLTNYNRGYITSPFMPTCPIW